MRLTLQKLNELILDEQKASEEYKALGFNNLARDELKHYHFLLKKRKQLYGY